MADYNTNFSYTKRAIDSVLKQDFQDFELIIIDDGSKENNRESLLEYAEKHEDKREQYKIRINYFFHIVKFEMKLVAYF